MFVYWCQSFKIQNRVEGNFKKILEIDLHGSLRKWKWFIKRHFGVHRAKTFDSQSGQHDFRNICQQLFVWKNAALFKESAHKRFNWTHTHTLIAVMSRKCCVLIGRTQSAAEHSHCFQSQLLVVHLDLCENFDFHSYCVHEKSFSLAPHAPPLDTRNEVWWIQLNWWKKKQWNGPTEIAIH